MGRSFYESAPLAREMVEAASDRLGVDFRRLLFEPNELLDQTPYTQPAILLVSAIAYTLFHEATGQRPLLALGHSLGELSALVAVGALEVLDGVELVHRRGRLMEEAAQGVDGGMMVVLGLEDRQVEELCAIERDQGKRVWPANYNSDGQIVVAGVKEDLTSLGPKFKGAGAKRALLLNMSVASHCPLMEPASKAFGPLLDESLKDSFQAPIISNVTAKPYEQKAQAVELLTRQLTHPVLYKHSIQEAAKEGDLFIEFGHGGVLAGLNRRITSLPTKVVQDMASLEEVVKELG